MAIGESEFVENPEPRCPVVLLLDTSSSMRGDPIAQLNEALNVFKREVSADPQASLRVEVAIITFGGRVELVQDFTTIVDFSPKALTPLGDTPMGEAIELGLEKIEQRKATYKTNGIYYYRPWIWLVTDGAPTDEKRWEQAAKKVHAGEDKKSFSFFAVGVQRANMDILRQIAPPARPPVQLNGLSFKDMFIWLSASMKKASTSKSGEQIALPPIEGWGTVDGNSSTMMR
jgi:uncharacterized protein YegL